MAPVFPLATGLSPPIDMFFGAEAGFGCIWAPDALAAPDVGAESVRVMDHDVKPGVDADMGDEDEWPRLREISETDDAGRPVLSARPYLAP